MERELKLGIYRHFKGEDKLVKVMGNAVHSETSEKMVIYVELYGQNIGQTYVRPIDMFLESIPDGRENPNNQEYRFEYIHE